ncbi:MAG: BlaI/MecI/CopY family transcriptional regulator [Pseudohongiellaceae bacterium]|nr:BlaI/MecI/CopY family transcriptional regulator [Pseudohongiellaceae bacterium]
MIKRRSSSNILPNTLGELELVVLEALWRKPHLDAKTVHESIPKGRRPSLNTVQSTLERLYKKTLVDRVKQGHAYTYFASVSRSNLLGRLMGDVIGLLHDGKLETILSSFVDVAVNLDECSLDELEQLIERKKKSIEEEGGDAK